MSCHHAFDHVPGSGAIFFVLFVLLILRHVLPENSDVLEDGTVYSRALEATLTHTRARNVDSRVLVLSIELHVCVRERSCYCYPLNRPSTCPCCVSELLAADVVSSSAENGSCSGEA